LADAELEFSVCPLSPVLAAATAAPEISAELNPTRTALVPSTIRRSPIARCLHR
jgi:hypothetical protein